MEKDSKKKMKKKKKWRDAETSEASARGACCCVAAPGGGRRRRRSPLPSLAPSPAEASGNLARRRRARGHRQDGHALARRAFRRVGTVPAPG